MALKFPILVSVDLGCEVGMLNLVSCGFVRGDEVDELLTSLVAEPDNISLVHADNSSVA